MLHVSSSTGLTMASQGPKPLALSLLFLNLVLYIIVAVIAGWAVNYGIEETAEKAARQSYSARLFPIYFPIGNMATGFFVMFSLIAGVVGIATSLSGLQNLAVGSTSNVASAAASSMVAWSLVLLSMGLACKEISIGWSTTRLRTLEVLTIILSGTQLLGAAAISASLMATGSSQGHTYGGRV